MLKQVFGTIPGLVRAHAAQRPTHLALIQDGRSLDYAELDALMDRVAASLQRDGVSAKDVIAICAPTSLEYAALFLGSLRAGVTVAPLALDSTGEALAAMAANARAKIFFLSQMSACALEAVGERIPAKKISLDDSAGGQAFSTWLAPPGNAPKALAIQPDWPFNIIYSSGTTGTPKGIVQSHALRWSQMQISEMAGYGPDAVSLISIPFYSNTTLSSFLPTLALGGTGVLMAKFDVEKYLALAEQHRVTHTMLVPVQYQRIMGCAKFGRYDLSSFRMKLCAGAPFAPALKADVLARWPGGLVEYYGMTEGGGACVLTAHEHTDKLHTVGMPIPGNDIRLIDDEGREVEPGEAGEIVGRSGIMMSGYYNEAAKTTEAEWFDAQGQRFIRSGDIGRFDEDGFLILVDRKKDMIISGGFNVYPSDLEAVLRDHADVADVAVVGVPSPRWGETPAAFVVLKAGASASSETLLAWTNGRLGKAQRLAALEIIGSLPRSDIGKVLKRELRYRYDAGKAGTPGA